LQVRGNAIRTKNQNLDLNAEESGHARFKAFADSQFRYVCFLSFQRFLDTNFPGSDLQPASERDSRFRAQIRPALFRLS
jgi:hypothetical protein